MLRSAPSKRCLTTLIAAPLLLLLAACTVADGDATSEVTPTAAPPTTPADSTSTTSTGASDDHATAYREQLLQIEAAVIAWRGADTIEEAHAAAESAANLVVGPNGPNYGDRDSNGTVNGETDAGILPGLDGSPAGLASPLAKSGDGNSCIVADVLGGAWDDPTARWTTMLTAIDEWRPSRNTMPTLPSHPMRVVGWATFTLASDSLDEAHEYAGHAQLHVNISLAALDC